MPEPERAAVQPPVRHRRRRLLLTAAVMILTTAAATTLPSPAHAIVGGTPVAWSQYPYIVRMRPSGCTGTLISTAWVLTAAHCVTGRHEGETITTGLSNGANPLAIEKRVHPLWEGDFDGYDLALVRISPAATVGVTRIQLGKPFELGPYLPQEATIVGVGQLGDNVPYDGILRAADTPLRSDDYMDDLYNPWYWFDGWIEHLMIGAGSTGQTICHGDSGGPLVVGRHTSRPVQVGVASFGSGLFGPVCNKAAGFMEMNGPQLAWVASIVPDIVPAWGDPCLTVWGTIGHPAATYGTGPKQDGPYHWNIWCSGPPPPLPPPYDPGPPPGPEDPPPPGCVRTCPPGVTAAKAPPAPRRPGP